MKLVNNRLVFATPKGGRERDVPLADSVALRLSAHLREFPAVTVTLPWRELAGKPVAVTLIFTTRERGAPHRNSFNHHVWKPALKAAGAPATRDDGMHALRHWYASVQLDGGTSIKALAEYVDHSDPGFTLRTYTHLMPASEDRARRAVDCAFGGDADGLVDAPQTSQAGDQRASAQVRALPAQRSKN